MEKGELIGLVGVRAGVNRHHRMTYIKAGLGCQTTLKNFGPAKTSVIGTVVWGVRYGSPSFKNSV